MDAVLYLLLSLLAAASAATPKTIESVIFRTADGEGLRGYLQTNDNRKKTIYCEATAADTATYKIKVPVLNPVSLFYMYFQFLISCELI